MDAKLDAKWLLKITSTHIITNIAHRDENSVKEHVVVPRNLNMALSLLVKLKMVTYI